MIARTAARIASMPLLALFVIAMMGSGVLAIVTIAGPTADLGFWLAGSVCLSMLAGALFVICCYLEGEDEPPCSQYCPRCVALHRQEIDATTPVDQVRGLVPEY